MTQVLQCIAYRATTMVWQRQLGLAQTYLIDLKRPVSGSRNSCSLHSSERGLLSVPFASTTIVQSHTSSVVAPMVWNGLPLVLRLLSRTLSGTFYNLFLLTAGVGSTSE